ncbi:TonB-dependent siderophore receptor [Sphingobacterium sp. InxBP1]|uniref:TonB-dependent receptor n=1 Tax=Sphingobacterium sp. InxBP1 TaxID=2870328 RepID=UPI002244CB51|nr:TonB-dependent receptor [Sphingobacterium sp. InxBP1]MCW8311506.1 TonB-dependent siderophore receptor [Sphingobacterium sp. InxBP1]
MNKFIIYLFLFIPASLLAQVQHSAEVYGKIFSSDGKPITGITVKLLPQDITVITKSNGSFQFKSLQAGAARLEISAVGLQPVVRDIQIEASKNRIADIYLNEDQTTLEEIVINGNGVNKYTRKQSLYVSKMPLNNLENSQSYTVITKELLKSQLNTNYDDALANVSGVDKLWASTGRPGDGVSYYTLRGFSTQAAMVNGVVGIASTSPDPANLETIEVIKGPSGTLYGGAAVGFGGLINNITKKPLDTVGGRLNYLFGSYAQHRFTADIYGPLTTNKKLLGRINTAFSNVGNYQDAGFNRSIFVAPSILFRANERLDIQLDAELFQNKATNPLMVFLNRSRQLFARTPDELSFDFNKSYTNNDVTFKNPTTNIRGNATYRFNEQWTSTTTVNYNRRKADGYFQYVMYLQPSNDTLINRYVADQNYTASNFNAQQNFVGDFHIGDLRNRLLVGVDYLFQQAESHNSPYILFDQLNTSFDDPRYSRFNAANIDAAIAASTGAKTNNRSRNQVVGAYVSDVLDLMPQLHLNLALRMDYFDNRGTYNFDQNTTTGAYHQTAFSPRAGVVYELLKDKVSFFANYQNGFKNVAPVVQPHPDISGDFKPQQASQWEAGVKLSLLNDKLGLTASYYDITVDNMLRTETQIIDGESYNITVQDGTRLSRGIDFDLTAAPIEGMNLIFSYSFNNSKTTKAAESVNNLRPTEAGPKHLSNVWANYTVQRGALKGFGIGAGLNYASKNLITNSVPTGVFTLPAYLLVNTSLSYRYKQVEFAIKGNNLTNQTYFKGWTTVNPQMPRNILGSIAYQF